MNRPVPDELLNAIERAPFSASSGIQSPTAIASALSSPSAPFSAGSGRRSSSSRQAPSSATEIRPYEDRVRKHPGPEARAQRPTVIVLDCSSPERIGELAEQIEGLPLLVVDHHSAGRSFGDVAFIDDSAPSVTLLILKIIERLGYEPELAEAKMLLFGLCTDTGFFRHLDARDPSVYEAIARLNAAGATPKEIHRMIFSGRPLASRLLLGRLLSRAEPHAGGQLLFTYETLADKRSFGAEHRDSDTLYQLLQGTAGCETVILIREEDEESCTVGLRSNSRIDVGVIAQQFGGGGHRRAAGFRWTGSRESAKAKLLEIVEPLLARS